MVEQMTKEIFQEKIFDWEKNQEWMFKGKQPCVIDFFADWCGPCKMLAPIIEELSTEYEGKVNFFTIDTEAEMELTGMFGISSIPSLIFIPAEGKPKMSVGAMPKDELKKIIDTELLNQ